MLLLPLLSEQVKPFLSAGVCTPHPLLQSHVLITPFHQCICTVACRSSWFRLLETSNRQIALWPRPHYFMERCLRGGRGSHIGLQIKAIIPWPQRQKSGDGCCKARLPSVWKYISRCSRPTPRHLCVAVASLKFTVSCSTRVPYCVFRPHLSARLKKASQEEISNPITGGASTPAAGAPQSECWWGQVELLNTRPAGVC